MEEQIKLHQNPNYGEASIYFAPLVAKLLVQMQAKSLSDYGAGKKNLLKTFNDLGAPRVEYFPYDPVFPEYGTPRPADVVCCSDVLEHIEPEFVDAVLDDLTSIVMKIAFFTIATRPAMKTLSEGRNAHLIQRPSSWWLPKLCRHFEIFSLSQDTTGHLILILLVTKIVPANG